MYFHQPTPTGGPRGQGSYLAFSHDGLQFLPRSEYLGLFYFRVFQHGGWHYALALLSAGNSIRARIEMLAITTRSSMSVKPVRPREQRALIGRQQQA
jgi:hypothetical protein